MHIPLTRIQKLIGERMSLSKRTKPCFSIESKADLTELMAARPKLRKKYGTKITTNAFYIHALGLAVREYPLAAGGLGGSPKRSLGMENHPHPEKDDGMRLPHTIYIAEHINVGFAVNAPQGLVVPVIRDADEKTLPEIARLEQSLTDKARDNLLTLKDIENETVALSNLGIYGIDSFLGIVPPPASTILSVGNIVSTVVCRDGQMIVRKILSMSLTVDKRIIDEFYAARFLNFIKEYLQNPQQLL